MTCLLPMYLRPESHWHIHRGHISIRGWAQHACQTHRQTKGAKEVCTQAEGPADHEMQEWQSQDCDLSDPRHQIQEKRLWEEFQDSSKMVTLKTLNRRFTEIFATSCISHAQHEVNFYHVLGKVGELQSIQTYLASKRGVERSRVRPVHVVCTALC